MIRRATSADVPALVETLVEGFAGDPIYAWLQPDPVRRTALMRDVFGFVVARGLERGEVWTTASGDGAAVWTEPGVELVDDGVAEAYLDLLRAHVGEARVGDVVEGTAALERHRPAQPHRVLHAIAARRPGAGVGAVLANALLDRCDGDGAGAYLDSTSPRNLPFYARLGFAVVAEEPVPGGGPVVRALVRSAARRPRGSARPAHGRTRCA
jgi:GNAT superfamily N-acetyltransferase